MIIENANEKDRDWFKRIEDMVKEDSMSLNYIKFINPELLLRGSSPTPDAISRCYIIN
jgi:hypothetical protein